MSTSSRLAQDAGKATEKQKEADNEAAGEAIGATDDASKGASAGDAQKAVAELQATIKEKDAKIKDLTVRGGGETGRRDVAREAVLILMTL